MAVISLSAPVLASCGSASSINANEVAPCPPGRQITGQQLRDALQRQGFSAVCFERDGRGVANQTPTGQGHRSAREGAVICQVNRSMPPRMAKHPHKVFEWGSLPTRSQPGRELMLANIDCKLYLDRDTRQDAPARIRQAFRALAVADY